MWFFPGKRKVYQGMCEDMTKPDIKKFVRDLDRLDVRIDPTRFQSVGQQSVPLNFKKITQDLVESHFQEFSFVISGPNFFHARKIERIYSKNEIRQMVCDHLIGEYQLQPIIDAVTDYLYGIHVGE